MQELAAGSKDVLKHNFVTNYYPARCTAMEKMSLHDVLANFTWAKVRALKPSDKHFAAYQDADARQCFVVFKRRREAHIVCPTWQPSIRDAKQRIDYVFNLLQLHVPWRTEADILAHPTVTDPTDVMQVLALFELRLKECVQLSDMAHKKNAMNDELLRAQEWQQEALNEPADPVCQFFILHKTLLPICCCTIAYTNLHIAGRGHRRENGAVDAAAVC